MKLTVVSLLLAFFAGVGSVVAQDERRDYSEERMKLRAEWMALDMAERYGLDEKQVKEFGRALWPGREAGEGIDGGELGVVAEAG